MDYSRCLGTVKTLKLRGREKGLNGGGVFQLKKTSHEKKKRHVSDITTCQHLTIALDSEAGIYIHRPIYLAGPWDPLYYVTARRNRPCILADGIPTLCICH